MKQWEVSMPGYSGLHPHHAASLFVEADVEPQKIKALVESAPALLQVVEDYLLLDELHDREGAVRDEATKIIKQLKGES